MSHWDCPYIAFILPLYYITHNCKDHCITFYSSSLNLLGLVWELVE
jgi:hypothetical protein